VNGLWSSSKSPSSAVPPGLSKDRRIPDAPNYLDLAAGEQEGIHQFFATLRAPRSENRVLPKQVSFWTNQALDHEDGPTGAHGQVAGDSTTPSRNTRPIRKTEPQRAEKPKRPAFPTAESVPVGMEKSELLDRFGRPNMVTTSVEQGQEPFFVQLLRGD
jgi:hypothetical protein